MYSQNIEYGLFEFWLTNAIAINALGFLILITTVNCIIPHLLTIFNISRHNQTISCAIMQ